MKFIAIMGHEETRPKVRALFQKYRVHMFSNIAIRGCNCGQKRDMEQQSWWPTDEMAGSYSSLCFAILDDDKADAIMLELEQNPISIENFPARAFLMNVEKTA